MGKEKNKYIYAEMNVGEWGLHFLCFFSSFHYLVNSSYFSIHMFLCTFPHNFSMAMDIYYRVTEYAELEGTLKDE